MRGLQSYVDATSLEPSLRELVNIRASQINACTFCLHMHLRDARKAGESQERLDLIGAWREAPVFSERERAALAWTEAVTLVADTSTTRPERHSRNRNWLTSLWRRSRSTPGNA
jgi:AhpD family alkylhydroperoxidase